MASNTSEEQSPKPSEDLKNARQRYDAYLDGVIKDMQAKTADQRIAERRERMATKTSNDGEGATSCNVAVPNENTMAIGEERDFLPPGLDFSKLLENENRDVKADQKAKDLWEGKKALYAEELQKSKKSGGFAGQTNGLRGRGRASE